MRIAHKIGVLIIAIALLLVLLLLPRHSQGQSSQDVGNYIVRYSAITTAQLQPEMATHYGIERSEKHGLLNIALQAKNSAGSDGTGPDMVRADVSASVGDLSGHANPIRFVETNEDGAFDYLGEFPLSGSGTYVFNVKITPPGGTQPYIVKFSHDYVVD